MGQCYSIYANMKTKDEAEVVRLARGFVEESSGYAHYSNADFADLAGMMENFFTKDVSKSHDGVYSADFDASYGWESIMQDMFKAIAPALEDGSYLEIWPDHGKDYLEVRDGKVAFEYTEEEDEEEEDE